MAEAEDRVYQLPRRLLIEAQLDVVPTGPAAAAAGKRPSVKRMWLDGFRGLDYLFQFIRTVLEQHGLGDVDVAGVASQQVVREKKLVLVIDSIRLPEPPLVACRGTVGCPYRAPFALCRNCQDGKRQPDARLAAQYQRDQRQLKRRLRRELAGTTLRPLHAVEIGTTADDQDQDWEVTAR